MATRPGKLGRAPTCAGWSMHDGKVFAVVQVDGTTRLAGQERRRNVAVGSLDQVHQTWTGTREKGNSREMFMIGQTRTLASTCPSQELATPTDHRRFAHRLQHVDVRIAVSKGLGSKQVHVVIRSIP